MSSKVLIVGKFATPKISVLVKNNYFSPISVSFSAIIFAFSAWLYAVILQDLLKSIIQTNNFTFCLQWYVTDENDVEVCVAKLLQDTKLSFAKKFAQIIFAKKRYRNEFLKHCK